MAFAIENLPGLLRLTALPASAARSWPMGSHPLPISEL